MNTALKSHCLKLANRNDQTVINLLIGPSELRKVAMK